MRMRSLSVALLALGACFDPSPSVSGALHASGDALGTWDFVPTAPSCKNGYDGDFVGVDLSDGVHAVRFLEDPAYGFTLVVATGGNIELPTAVYRAADCTTFEANISTDSGDDNGDAVSGGFAVACPAVAPDAMTVGIHGAIAFAHCDGDSAEGS